MARVKDFYTLKNKVSKSGNSIKIGNITYTPRQFQSKFKTDVDAISAEMGRANFYGKIGEIATKTKSSEDDTIVELGNQVFTAILEPLKKEAQEKIAGNLESHTKGYKYAGKIPIIDRSSNKRLMFDDARKCIDHGSSYKSWLEYRQHQPKEVKDMMSMSVTVADILYDPQSSMKAELREVNGQDEVLTINAHVMPKWREHKIDSPVLPKMFDTMIRFMFDNDEESIEYFYNWAYYMLTDRNHVMLLLHGGRGIGKGSLLQILRELVGLENFSAIPSGFFDSRFNGELKFKRLVAFDEFPVKREFINEWKALPEPWLSIEEKGAEVVNYVNHASYIVTNNTEAEVSILCDERKFSVPRCRAEGELVDHVGLSVWEDFMQSILSNDKDVLGNLGWWIIENGKSKKYDNRRPFKSDVFYEIVEKALHNWQRGLIQEIERRESEEIHLSHIEDVLRGTGRTKIEKFLVTHKDRDGDYYGYLKQLTGGERVIVPSPKYRPEGSTDKSRTSSKSDDIDLSSLEF